MFGYKKWYYAYHKLLWHFFGPNKGFALTLPKYIILSKRKKKKKRLKYIFGPWNLSAEGFQFL